MDVGDRIAAWRDTKGLTQHDLAERVGVTYAAVYQWETHRTTPTLAMLSKIVKALGVSLERFYGRLPKKAAS
jgi:transcriptional regulator with XRE-family HTH domain